VHIKTTVSSFHMAEHSPAELPAWIEELRQEPSQEETDGESMTLQRRFTQRMLVRALQQHAAAENERQSVVNLRKMVNEMLENVERRIAHMESVEKRVLQLLRDATLAGATSNDQASIDPTFSPSSP
jgi:hypothetical protein